MFLSLPPPKIFWKKFFFLGWLGCVVSGALPSGGVLGVLCETGGVAGGVVAGAVGELGCGVG